MVDSGSSRLFHRLFAGLACALILAHCGPSDPQVAALNQLTAAGYTLSVPEYHRAAAAGDTAALQLFLTCGTLVDVPLFEGDHAITALRTAIRHGHDAATAFLLKNGARLRRADSDASEPLLRLAVASGNENLVRQLLHQPDLPPSRLEPLLLDASKQGEVSLIEALLEHDPSLPLDPCLLHAASQGHLGMTDFLLQHGAHPDATDPSTQRTALIEAAAQGHHAVIDLLLAAGASRFLADAGLRLAADHAAQNQHADIATLLWQPLTRYEQELGCLPADHSLPPPAGWETASAPAIPLTPPPALNPDQPRPLSRLHHAIVGHHSGLSVPPPPRQRIELHTVRPSQLPFRLLELDAATAKLEDLTHPGRNRLLKLNQPIADTGWQIAEIRPPSPSTMPSWLSGLVVVQHPATRSYLALIPGAPARHSPRCAVIHIAGTDEFYEGHEGDTFRFTNAPAPVTLIAIQPRLATFKDTAGTFTIALAP